MLMRLQRADWLLLAVIGVLGMIAALLTATTPPEKVESLWDDFPSTFFNDEDGTKALFLVSEELELSVDRLRRVITPDAIRHYDGIVVLRPIMPFTRDERRVLIDWVRRGGRLLIAPSAQFSEWFNIHDIDPEFGARDDQKASDAGVRSVNISSDDPILVGVRELRTRSAVRLDEQTPITQTLHGFGAIAEPIWVDSDGIAMLRVAVGRGTMFVLGDTYPLSNIGIGQADNALLASNLLHVLAGPTEGSVAFDEFHLGHEQRDDSVVAVWRLLFEGERGLGLAHAAVVGLLALLVAGVRFGRPVDVIHRRRRRHGEFVSAAGRLLDDANATDSVAATLLEHYRHRFVTMLRLDTTIKDDDLAGVVREQVGHDIASALALRNRASHISRQKLLEAVTTLHRAMEALEHGSFGSHR